MILDGAVDPNADPIEADIRQAAAFQTGVQRLRRRLRQGSQLPAGHRSGQGRRRLPRMVDPLVDKPAKTEDPRGLSYSDAIIGTILPLYSPNLWRHLTAGLTEIKDGRGDTMLALADLYMGRDAAGPLHQRDRRARRRQLRRQTGDHRPGQGRSRRTGASVRPRRS